MEIYGIKIESGKTFYFLKTVIIQKFWIIKTTLKFNYKKVFPSVIFFKRLFCIWNYILLDCREDNRE